MSVIRLQVVNKDGKKFDDEIEVVYRRVEIKLDSTARTIRGWECSITHPEGGLCTSNPQAEPSAAFDQAMQTVYEEVQLGTSYNEDLDGPRDGTEAIRMHGVVPIPTPSSQKSTLDKALDLIQELMPESTQVTSDWLERAETLLKHLGLFKIQNRDGEKPL